MYLSENMMSLSSSADEAEDVAVSPPEHVDLAPFFIVLRFFLVEVKVVSILPSSDRSLRSGVGFRDLAFVNLLSFDLSVDLDFFSDFTFFDRLCEALGVSLFDISTTEN